ncbi:DUF1656 domain-containing protein [Chimaeribacter californicus]|uniref:DUF1656 domain-containing protein n=1 Tax=Chimaeribacter californicus TaxID=2060067 RepID=UPI00269F95BF
MNIPHFLAASPLQDVIFGASLYFPPIFKAFALGFVLWLLIHHALREKIYAGDIWHPLLMDLALFVIMVSVSQWFLVKW